MDVTPQPLPERKKRNIFVDLRKLLSDINIKAVRGAFQSANFVEGFTGWRLNSNGLIEGTRLRLDNFIGRDDTSIVFSGTTSATASRSRTSNVATIITSTAHGLTTNDTVTISGMSDSTYNGSYKTVTVVNATTFTYSSTGGDEGTITDTSGSVTTWSNITVNPFYGGKAKSSSTVGDTFTITFTGTSVGVVAEISNTMGKISFSLDGGEAELVDLYQVNTTGAFTRSVVYQRTDLPNKEHVLIGTVATKNASSGGNEVRIQGYVKSPTPGIKVDAISADVFAVAVNGLTDGNGYVQLSLPALPTGYSSWHITGARLNQSVMSDATLTDPKISFAGNAVYLYNGAATTTYAVLVEYLVSKT